MKIFLNLAKGFSLIRKNASLIIIFFLANFILSLILTYPIYSSLDSSLSTSKVGDKAVEEFDYLWWQEFRDQANGIEKTFLPSKITGKGLLLDNLVLLKNIGFLNLPYPLSLGFLLFLIAQVFLSAGIISVYNQENVISRFHTFFSEGVRFFSRFLLIMFFSWILFFLAGFCLNQLFGSWVNKVAENSISERAPFFLNLFFSLVILLILFFVQMLFDYARINVVVNNSKNVIKSIINAFSFVFNNIGKTLGLYYLIIFIHLMLAVAFSLFERWLPQNSFLMIIALFFVQQIFVLGVITVRLWLYASELSLFKDIKRKAL